MSKCTFREKLSSFNNRFKEKGDNADKKEVSKYMRKDERTRKTTL